MDLDGMIFRQLFDRESSTYTYLVADAQTGEAALVDSVLENVERDLGLVQELGCRLVGVFDTHLHADHVTSAATLRERTSARTYVSALSQTTCADVELVEGDVVSVGDVTFTVLATPGHTSGCTSLVVASEGDPLRVLTGDALLIRGCGRTDFQGGSSLALWRSIQEKLFTLPESTLVYPGHDYHGFTVSTIGEEKRLNARVGASMSLESFVTLMENLHLPAPARMREAVPANRACGRRPALQDVMLRTRSHAPRRSHAR